MAQIGFTTGVMHESYIPLEERVKVFKAAGANAVELSFGTLCAFKEFNISDDLLETLSGYELVTIHAPWRDVRYNRNSAAVISRLWEICSQQKIYGIVVHPNTIDDYSVLADSGLPFLIENMDSKARCGTRPNEFAKLKDDYNFGFVLDLQHAYIHDSSMQLAGELMDAMGERIREFHVSGQLKDKNHMPLHSADNSNLILGMLRNDIPIILEGKIEGPAKESVEAELNLVRQVLHA